MKIKKNILKQYIFSLLKPHMKYIFLVPGPVQCKPLGLGQLLFGPGD